MQTGVYFCLLNWERKVNVFKRCLKYFSVLLLAVLLPAQAFAQLSCDGSTSGQVVTSPPFFEGDTTRLEIGIGATSIQGGSYIEIPGWSYFLDCAASDIWPSCTDQPSDVEYLGNISTNCVNGAGEPIVWNASNANEVDFVATNGPVRVLAGSQCQISFDIRTNTLAPPDNFRVRGRQGFNTGVCDNDEPGSAAGGLTIVYGSCSIDIEKQVSVTGGAPFFDADTSPGIDLEYPPGDALFQLLVTNNGTTDYVEPIKIVDPGLGIDTTIPALLAGQSATVSASGTPPLISALAASGWCTTPGPKENTSEATGVCRSSELVDASDNNNAWVNCVPPPSIAILKEISLDGNAPWFDANDAASAPVTEYDSDAYYRLTVTNDGLVDLVDVTINDATLGIGPVNIGNLAAGANTVLTSGSTGFGALYAVDRCTEAGTFLNTATADGDSAVTGTPATQATDPANLVCVEPPSITILKEISLDGNAPWFDANDAASAPVTEYDSDAYYRLTVTNDGLVDLVDVTINDATLGIGPVNIGNLAAGANTVLTSGSTGFGALYAVDRCTTAGTFLNTATADGKSAITGLAVPQASDPANLVCVPPPLIDILKEISLDGNAPWYDANDAASAPVAVPPSDAYYRITVTNTGLVDLVNVTINDATLGIGPVNIGNLAAGANTVLTSGSTGFGALYAVDRCTTDGTYLNTATADGDSAETGKAAPQVSDPANLVCDSPGMAICRTPGFWGARGGDEKADKGSRNITLEVLGDGFEICGIPITDTDVASGNSAIEAICINKGDPLAKYIRMATSAALNCNLADCGEIETVLANCNAACIADDQDTDALNACAAELGCFNEGGMYIDGQCHFAGECYFDGEPTGEVCSFDSDGDNAEPSVPCLGQGEVCERVETCHDRNLCPDLEDDGQLNGSDFCFEPPGPASSPKKCNDARKNGDYIFDF